MNYLSYKISASTDYTVYYFTSTGPKGDIQKAIKFNLIDSSVYNLSFGEIINFDERTQITNIDDETISNNGDLELILATVAHSIYVFTSVKPSSVILFMGNSPAKNRLYRIAISRNYNIISKTFHIFGAVSDTDNEIISEPYDEKANVMGYFIKRK